jgi:hypothetical protein
VKEALPSSDARWKTTERGDSTGSRPYAAPTPAGKSASDAREEAAWTNFSMAAFSTAAMRALTASAEAAMA